MGFGWTVIRSYIHYWIFTRKVAHENLGSFLGALIIRIANSEEAPVTSLYNDKRKTTVALPRYTDKANTIVKQVKTVRQTPARYHRCIEYICLKWLEIGNMPLSFHWCISPLVVASITNYHYKYLPIKWKKYQPRKNGQVFQPVAVSCCNRWCLGWCFSMTTCRINHMTRLSIVFVFTLWFFHSFIPLAYPCCFIQHLSLGTSLPTFSRWPPKRKARCQGLADCQTSLASLINIQWGIHPLHHGMVEDVEVLDVVPSPSNDIMQAKLTQGSSGGAMVCLWRYTPSNICTVTEPAFLRRPSNLPCYHQGQIASMSRRGPGNLEASLIIFPQNC